MEVQIIYEKSQETICFAVEELENILLERDYTVKNMSLTGLDNLQNKNQIVISTQENSLIQGELQKSDITVSDLNTEGFMICKIKRQNSLLIIGADAKGAMYGTLELADLLQTGKDLNSISSFSKDPHINIRGIKFNLPLDARTPSYSDNGDSAQCNIKDMWDLDFWQEFIDELARDRFNVLTLWNLHPFPSMVKVTEYPDVALDDIKKKKLSSSSDWDLEGRSMVSQEMLANLETIKTMTIEEKITFWRKVMQYANHRGIDIYIITWNVFVFGTENSKFNITDSLDNKTTIDYFRKSVRTLFETYPLLKGIGVTAGENMDGSKEEKENWLWETYGKGVQDAREKFPDRTIKFVHRQHQTDTEKIADIFSGLPDFNKPGVFSFSFKYSKAHMYSSVKPIFINRINYLEKLPEGIKTALEVRNDDNYYRLTIPRF